MNQIRQPVQDRHEAHFNYRHLSSEELDAYADQGFLLLDDVLTEQGVAEMRDQCMSYWSAQKEGYDPDGSWLKNMLLDDAHHHAPVVRDYYFEGPLVNIAEQLIGPNIKGVTAQLTFKLRGNTKRVHWHQDNVYGELAPYNAITCLTALDKSDEANGCLWIAPGSHKDGQRRAGFTEEERTALIEIELKPDDSNAIPMPMEPGQCLMFSCWTYHRSDGNNSKERDRRILFIRYADADAVEVYNDNRPRLAGSSGEQAGFRKSWNLNRIYRIPGGCDSRAPGPCDNLQVSARHRRADLIHRCCVAGRAAGIGLLAVVKER